MIASIADSDDQIADKFLNEQDPSTEEIRRDPVTIALKMTPSSSAPLQEKGVQLLLQRRQPVPADPTECRTSPRQNNKEEKVILTSEPKAPFVAWPSSSRTALRQLTYMRIYQGPQQGRLHRQQLANGKRIKVPRSCACTRTS